MNSSIKHRYQDIINQTLEIEHENGSTQKENDVYAANI